MNQEIEIIKNGVNMKPQNSDIRKHLMIEYDLHRELEDLLKNPTLNDTRILKHPLATVKMLASIGNYQSLLFLLPEIAQWEANGEEVRMKRVRHLLISANGLYGKLDKLKENPFYHRLLNVNDTYFGFIMGVLTYTQKSAARQASVEKFMEDNPDALSSDILEFISNQPDFL